jgi:hypothetical protein
MDLPGKKKKNSFKGFHLIVYTPTTRPIQPNFFATGRNLLLRRFYQREKMSGAKKKTTTKWNYHARAIAQAEMRKPDNQETHGEWETYQNITGPEMCGRWTTRLEKNSNPPTLSRLLFEL